MSAVYKRGNAVLSANLTPMIDVTFLLIVFFVLVSQIVEVESVDMELPQPTEPLTEQFGDEQRAVINVVPLRETGQIEGYRLGTRTFAPGPEGVEALTVQLAALLQSNPALSVNLRADRDTHYQFVEPAMQAVANAAARVEGADVRGKVNLVVINPERSPTP